MVLVWRYPERATAKQMDDLTKETDRLTDVQFWRDLGLQLHLPVRDAQQ